LGSYASCLARGSIPLEASKDVLMRPSHQPPSAGNGRQRPKTLAERAEECTDVQRRLKEEAAERRRTAIAKGAPREPVGLSQRTLQSGRRTP
jgi:hypothetical protein